MTQLTSLSSYCFTNNVLQEEIDLEALENLSINGGLMLPTGEGDSNILVGLYRNGATINEEWLDMQNGVLQLNIAYTEEGELDSITLRLHHPSSTPMHMANQNGYVVLDFYIPGNT